MKTEFLLDTCAVIWIATNQPMSERARMSIEETLADGDAVAVSAITAWELGLLSRKGRLPSTRPPLDLFNAFADADGIEVTEMSPEILIGSSFLPGDIHNDPADRIIIATARALDLTVVTRDRAVLDYAEQGYVRALAC